MKLSISNVSTMKKILPVLLLALGSACGGSDEDDSGSGAASCADSDSRHSAGRWAAQQSRGTSAVSHTTWNNSQVVANTRSLPRRNAMMCPA